MQYVIKYTFFISLCVIASQAFGQQKYWVFFKDKQEASGSFVSEETIHNRKKYGLPEYQYTDLPINTHYITELKNAGINPLHFSKWFNGVSAILTNSQKELLEKFPFVESIDQLNQNIVVTSSATEVETQSYSVALMQMQSNLLVQKGITGKDVKIGVIDAGFYRANSDKYLEHLFSEFRIMGQRDFLDRKRTDLITDQATESDGHGRRVLDMITGYARDEKNQIGLAVNAQFYLARTENGAREYRGEEDTWIEALDWCR